MYIDRNGKPQPDIPRRGDPTRPMHYGPVNHGPVHGHVPGNGVSRVELLLEQVLMEVKSVRRPLTQRNPTPGTIGTSCPWCSKINQVSIARLEANLGVDAYCPECKDVARKDKACRELARAHRELMPDRSTIDMPCLGCGKLNQVSIALLEAGVSNAYCPGGECEDEHATRL